MTFKFAYNLSFRRTHLKIASLQYSPNKNREKKFQSNKKYKNESRRYYSTHSTENVENDNFSPFQMGLRIFPRLSIVEIMLYSTISMQIL